MGAIAEGWRGVGAFYASSKWHKTINSFQVHLAEYAHKEKEGGWMM